MLQSALKKVFGDRNQRLLKKMGKTVAQINALESELQALSDSALAAKTAEFRERASNGEGQDALLVEAFAVVREASVRTLGLRTGQVATMTLRPKASDFHCSRNWRCSSQWS